MKINSISFIFVCGLFITVILYTFIFLTGQTFGQRAAQKYPYNSPQWKNEVHRLATSHE